MIRERPITLKERVIAGWWWRKYRIQWFVYEGVHRWIAGRLPKKIVLFAFVRASAYASSGTRCGKTSPDDLTYPLIYDRWEEQSCD